MLEVVSPQQLTSCLATHQDRGDAKIQEKKRNDDNLVFYVSSNIISYHILGDNGRLCAMQNCSVISSTLALFGSEPGTW